MAEECREMITFVSFFCTFKFEVMPSVLIKAPSTFHLMMYYVLKYIPFVRVYFDDTLIFSNSMKEHIYHLTVFFKAVGEALLELKITKFVFAMPSVKLLGCFVYKRGVPVDEEKIDSIKRAPNPTN